MVTMALHTTQRGGYAGSLPTRSAACQLSSHILFCAMLTTVDFGCSMSYDPERQAGAPTASLQHSVGSAFSVTVPSGTRTAFKNWRHEKKETAQGGKPAKDMNQILHQLHQICQQAIAYEKTDEQSNTFRDFPISLPELCSWYFKLKSPSASRLHLLTFASKQENQQGQIGEHEGKKITFERSPGDKFLLLLVSIFMFFLGYYCCPHRGKLSYVSTAKDQLRKFADKGCLLLGDGKSFLYRRRPGTVNSLESAKEQAGEQGHLPDEMLKQTETETQELSAQTANILPVLLPDHNDDKSTQPSATNLSNSRQSNYVLPVYSCSCNVPPSSDFHNNNEETLASTTDEDVTTGAKQQMQAIVRVKMENRPYQRLVKVSLSSNINSTLAEITTQSPNEQVFALPLSMSGTVNVRLHSDDLLDGVTGCTVEQRHLVRLFGQVVNIVTDVDYSPGKASGFLCMQIATESDILHRTIKVQI